MGAKLQLIFSIFHVLEGCYCFYSRVCDMMMIGGGGDYNKF